MLIGFKCFVYIYHYQVICHIMIQYDLSKFSALELSRYTLIVMNIEWDYNYYQPWSDNEWLVDEMLAMLDKDIIMQ